MIEAAVDALLEAADDGIDDEGLAVERTGDAYRFAVPGLERDDLDAAELEGLVAEHPAYVAEWYYWHRVVPQEPARWTFLRWLEGAEDRPVPARRDALETGRSREWGQLLLAVTADSDGPRRQYAVRHVDDADRPRDALERLEPAAVREFVRTTEDGEYRPLATAPTLPAGWTVSGLDGAGLVGVVENVYPATVANWYREREGDLDVTHWREAAARQTGIYDLVDELAGEQVAWLAEACCVDSQCLKRRQWDETAAEALDVPRGDGVFPCREPCSFVIAAAREFALAERESPDETTVTLSAAEREQLERIVDVVADGEVADVRDGDFGDGANRLRTRYLRAKHAAEDGTFRLDDSTSKQD